MTHTEYYEYFKKDLEPISDEALISHFNSSVGLRAIGVARQGYLRALWASLDERNIEWKRSKEIVLFWVDSKQITRRYYPDFYLPKYNIYVDPKNKYKQKLDEEKINFIQNKYNLLVGSVEECKKQIILNINLQVC